MKYSIIVFSTILVLAGILLTKPDSLDLQYPELDWFAIQSADEANKPEGLSERELEIYRAGFANGHYSALHPAYIEGVYVLNTKTKKFHFTNCMTTLMIETDNRKHSTLSPEELISQGYKPCGQCNPERQN